MKFKIELLPPSSEVETKAVLKQLSAAHRYLALLNGRCATIPNENILINTLALQEAKESSAIENIITTYDELYQLKFSCTVFAGWWYAKRQPMFGLPKGNQGK